MVLSLAGNSNYNGDKIMGFGLSLIGLAVVLILVVLGVVKAVEIIGNRNKRIK
ncbi:hypothetical protein A28LD_0968 [Idiomarina sp. A28L]|nr:hypothetical protein A28LD_0968 [Idiomarina sp. A28L]